MKIIVPMAGRGSRLRPHTLTVPKPLVPVAGKPIVHRLVEDIAAMSPEKVTEIAFVIGDFGKAVEEELLAVAESLGAKGSIHHQEEPLGTAHAVMCAKEKLDGPVTVAFADTLFKADFELNKDADAIFWVKQIDNPSAFGVIKMNEGGEIIDFVEKPQTFVSDLAMIGIYYFKEGKDLRTELEYLIDNDVIKGGEYQLPDALKRMTEKGNKCFPGEVSEWMDCGNKKVTVETNQRVLIHDAEKGINNVHASAVIENSVINQPCFIGEGAVIKNSVVGPHVSVGKNTAVADSIIKNTNIQADTRINKAILENAMIGNKVTLEGRAKDLSIGDFCEITE